MKRWLKGLCSNQYKKLFKGIDNYSACVCAFILLVHVKYMHMHAQEPLSHSVPPSPNTHTETYLENSIPTPIQQLVHKQNLELHHHKSHFRYSYI